MTTIHETIQKLKKLCNKSLKSPFYEIIRTRLIVYDIDEMTLIHVRFLPAAIRALLVEISLNVGQLIGGRQRAKCSS